MDPQQGSATEKYSVTFQETKTLGIEFAPNIWDQVEYTGAAVKSILKDSIAHATGKIAPGDVLVQVNNEVLTGGYEATTNILRLQGRPITLTFQRPVPTPEAIYEEEFAEGHLGLDLQMNSFEGQEYSGAVVKQIRPNSQAMSKRRLKLGHVLIAVNGHNLEVGFADTMALLFAQPRPMRLTFQDPTLPAPEAQIDTKEKEYKVVFGEGSLGLDLQQNKWQGQEYSGAVVKNVLSGGQAHEDGRIQVGHVLVAINDQPLMVGFMATMNLLKTTGRPVALKFHDPHA